MKIANEELEERQYALAATKAYRHPKSKKGIAQDVALRIRVLDRQLRQAQRDWIDEKNDNVKEFGTLRDPAVEGSWHVANDSPRWMAFQEAMRELNATQVEFSDKLQIKLTELRVRDENGNWEKMEFGELADLGEILDDEGAFKLEEPKPEEAPAT